MHHNIIADYRSKENRFPFLISTDNRWLMHEILLNTVKNTRNLLLVWFRNPTLLVPPHLSSPLMLVVALLWTIVQAAIILMVPTGLITAAPCKRRYDQCQRPNRSYKSTSFNSAPLSPNTGKGANGWEHAFKIEGCHPRFWSWSHATEPV